MKRKLGELLIESGAVTEADVESALSEQSLGEPSRLGDLLLSTGRCTPRQLAEALAAQNDLPFADLSYVAPEASALIPLAFQQAHKLVPFRVERDAGHTRIHVALADPTLSDVVAELRSQLRREIVVHVAPIDDIENVHHALGGEGGEAGLVVGTVLDEDGLELTHEAPFPDLGPSLAQPSFPPLQPTPAPDPDFFAVEEAPADAVAEPGFPPLEPTPSPDADFFSLDESGSEAASAVTMTAHDPAPAIDLAPPPAAAQAASAEAGPASVTAEELFGSLDLEATPATAPLSTDLADEIGRADAAPPHLDFAGFAALAPPMEPMVDRFGAAPSAPALKVVPERKLTAAPSAPEQPAPEEPLLELLDPLIEPELLTVEVADTALAAEPRLAVTAPAPPLASVSPEVTGVNDHTQKFGGAVPHVEPKRIPSFAIPPEVPVEPRRSPVAPLRPGTASLGRIALKRVAVNRDGTPVSSPAAPRAEISNPGPALVPAPTVAAAPPAVEEPAPSAPAPAPASDLNLPDWMRAASDPPPAIPVILKVPTGPSPMGAKLEALLARVETGDLPSGPSLAALFRLLVERGILDEAAVAAALEKI